jgi:AraC-like DNA-binding protein
MKSDHKHRNHPEFKERVWAHLDYKHDKFNLPLKIITSGSSQWGAGHFFSRTRSELFGIELVTSGNARFSQDNKSYLIEDGELFILRKGSRHLYKVGPAGYLHKRYITMDGMMLQPLLRACNLSETDMVRPHSPVRIKCLLKKINRTLTEKKTGFTKELSGLGYRLLLELGESAVPSYPAAIARALEFIHQNLRSSFDAFELSRYSGLSQTHLNRLFRQHLRCSPLQFFINQRMAWAQHLLTETSSPIKKIAATIGYDDPLYFSAQFRGHFGTSPKFYREKSLAPKTGARG